MGRFDISPEVAEEYRGKFREAVMPHLSDEILAVGTFRTTGSGTKYAISKTQAGALLYGAASLVGKGRAGGMPSQFLLAVTPTKLHAFKYKMKGKGVEVRQPVAEWDRAGLKLELERLTTTTRVKLEWPDGGEKLVFDQDGMGDNPWADDVVRVLQTSPSAVA
jgi:hypothetical protein